MEETGNFFEENIESYLPNEMNEQIRQTIIHYFEALKSQGKKILEGLTIENYQEMLARLVGVDRKMQVLFSFLEFNKKNPKVVEAMDIVELVETDYVKYHWDQYSENSCDFMTKSLFYKVE